MTQLRDRMRTSDDEAVRQACYQGLRSIGPQVAERLCEIVKERNRLGKLQVRAGDHRGWDELTSTTPRLTFHTK